MSHHQSLAIRRWVLVATGMASGVMGFFLVIVLFSRKANVHPVTRWPPEGDSNRVQSMRPGPAQTRLSSELASPLGEVRTSPILKGRILDAVSLRPVPSAMVAWHDQPECGVETDVTGAFDLEARAGLPATFLVVAEGYSQMHILLHEIPEARPDIPLQKSRRVRFMVSDDVTGLPVAGARVQLGESRSEAFTNAQGIAEDLEVLPYLELRQGQGIWKTTSLSVAVTITASGYRRYGNRHDLHSSSESIFIRVRPVTEITGVVLDTFRQPVPHATVAVHWTCTVNKSTREMDSSKTQANELGAFTLKIPSGREGVAFIGAGQKGYAPQAIQLRLGPDLVPEPVRLFLPASVQVEGQVVNEDAHPIEGVGLTVVGEGLFQGFTGTLRRRVGEAYGAPLGKAATDTDGTFFLDGLLAGTWSLMAEHPLYVQIEPLSFTLPSRSDLNVAMVTGESASGIVVDLDGNSVPGATVMIGPRGSEPRLFEVDQDGLFNVGALKPETPYIATASAKGFRSQMLEVRAGEGDIVFALEPRVSDEDQHRGELQIKVRNNGYGLHDRQGFFLIALYDAGGVRRGSYRRGTAVGGAIAIDRVPEGRFCVALSSDRYAPVLIEDVLTVRGAPAVVADIEHGCVVSAHVLPLSRGRYEIRDMRTGLPLMPVEANPEREGEASPLGVLARGESYLLAVVDGREVISSRIFTADCDGELRFDLVPQREAR